MWLSTSTNSSRSSFESCSFKSRLRSFLIPNTFPDEGYDSFPLGAVWDTLFILSAQDFKLVSCTKLCQPSHCHSFFFEVDTLNRLLCTESQIFLFFIILVYIHGTFVCLRIWFSFFSICWLWWGWPGLRPQRLNMPHWDGDHLPTISQNHLPCHLDGSACSIRGSGAWLVDPTRYCVAKNACTGIICGLGLPHYYFQQGWSFPGLPPRTGRYDGSRQLLPKADPGANKWRSLPGTPSEFSFLTVHSNFTSSVNLFSLLGQVGRGTRVRKLK